MDFDQLNFFEREKRKCPKRDRKKIREKKNVEFLPHGNPTLFKYVFEQVQVKQCS